MFCPTCGRGNSKDRKFCVSCGTNLEAVSQALSGVKDDFFTKTDMALDQFIARYAEHVFKNAPAIATERKVSKSWKVLGQGILTSFVDMILFSLMWNILPLRFLILLISTPIRLLSERSDRKKIITAEFEERPPMALPERWQHDPVSSISENTTENLKEYREAGGKEKNEVS